MAGIFPIPHILPTQNLIFFRFKTSHSSDPKPHILPIQNLTFFRFGKKSITKTHENYGKTAVWEKGYNI